MKRMDKKGQQMTLGTIIAIVLGIVVLIFLIYGFSTGWSNLWERITGLGGGNVNVDTIKTACTLACQQQNKYGFCNQSRKVTIESGDSNTSTCQKFVGEVNFGEGDDMKKVNIGVSACPGLC